MSAFEVDEVDDIASGAEGFFGGAGRAANWPAAFCEGAVFADKWAGG
jgi:hypothetical protein